MSDPRERRKPRLRVVPHFSFLAWGDFHARSRFARPTIPEEKWGTTRSLTETEIKCLDVYTNSPDKDPN